MLIVEYKKNKMAKAARKKTAKKKTAKKTGPKKNKPGVKNSLVNNINAKIQDITQMKKLVLNGQHEIDFDPAEDISFLFTETLPYHPNALTFLATTKDNRQIAETWIFAEHGEERINHARAETFAKHDAVDIAHIEVFCGSLDAERPHNPHACPERDR